MTPLAEALKLVRKQRKDDEKDFPPDRKFQKTIMSPDDRDRLGALFHVLASQLGEARPYAGSWEVEYHVPTSCGVLQTHYAPNTGTIFGRFDDPGRASRVFHEMNPHTGKWNLHTGRGDVPEKIIAMWERDLRSVLT